MTEFVYFMQIYKKGKASNTLSFTFGALKLIFRFLQQQKTSKLDEDRNIDNSQEEFSNYMDRYILRILCDKK